ncbi:MAG: hypothetical protein JO332_14430 [Planctomycetaceae bacterium]|nr:hypothetical protein [Planctomycetaceae bacterium]
MGMLVSGSFYMAATALRFGGGRFERRSLGFRLLPYPLKEKGTGVSPVPSSWCLGVFVVSTSG